MNQNKINAKISERTRNGSVIGTSVKATGKKRNLNCLKRLKQNEICTGPERYKHQTETITEISATIRKETGMGNWNGKRNRYWNQCEIN